ncbi:molybdopterin-binding/glycosyltransferase family 2 protein [Mesorhizobium koreense]|uniref:molybdopterin-binding/glycosyltransferase family 2 protein n=1 Tax=Mesorhizobium koreense TaxID=3074855 RepID=UPI00287BBE61|nr:molybdopterin-binding/glycosyltransferase family 2 protein [Mesorhizobium sp. WR6]
MRFGPIPIEDAEGAILAHATTAGERRLRKAHRLTAEDVKVLAAAGVREVVAASLASDDVDENEAAARIAGVLKHSGIEVKPAATGRVNLHAKTTGVFTVDKELVDSINHVDPAVTIATVAAFAPVVAGQMVATVKIIPFAVPEAVVDWIASLTADHTIFEVHPYRAWSVGVVQTVLPSVKQSVLDKTRRVTEARLARSGSRVSEERRTPHEPGAVAQAISELSRDNDMVLVFGASAVCDPEDVIPAAIRESGGTVFRAGMPVDPGNLLILGERGGRPVLGAPGCARSPKENGFDWVLDRLIAGVPVTEDDIAGMGVGGLLMEIPTRPQPREPAEPARRAKVYTIVLAAGRSSRMGGPNKLLASFGGKKLVRLVAERVRASRADGVVVVTGHQADRVRDALAGINVRFADNPDYASGLAGSLKAGIRALPADADGAMVVLGDMPGVDTADFDALITAFARASGHAIVRATHAGKRGNPVILPHSVFPAVESLEGDVGARHLVEAGGVEVVDVEIGEGASIDVDTPDALALAGGVVAG